MKMAKSMLVFALFVISTAFAADTCTWKTYENTLIVLKGETKYKVYRGITREECKNKCATDTSIKCASIDYDKTNSDCYLTTTSMERAEETFTLRIGDDYSKWDLMVCEGDGVIPRPQVKCTWKTYENTLIVMKRGTTKKLYRGLTREECQQKCLTETDIICKAANYEKANSNCHLTPNSVEEANSKGIYRTPYPAFDLMVCEEEAPPPKPEICTWQTYKDELIVMRTGSTYTVYRGITRDQCIEKCRRSTLHKCVSINYQRSTSNCYLVDISKEKAKSLNIYRAPYTGFDIMACEIVKVNGGWTDFVASGDCSKSCGGGSQTFTRSCTNPAPKNGGDDCDGDATKTETCNTQACPINGGWSNFVASGDCSKSCGGGSQTFTRSCTNPKPQYGGDDCDGDATKTETCNTQACPINGGWSGWSKSGGCSKSCGSGSQKYVRNCSNPKPAHGGKQCSGSTTKTESCLVKHCPVNGGWSDWSKYGSCSKSCGSGSQKYVRSCSKPAPAHGGNKCSGMSYQYKSCNTHKCPFTVDFGHAVNNRRYIDAWSNAMYIWEPHRAVTTTGTVKQWKFYARNTGTIYLQVFSRYSGSRYQLKGQTRASVTRTGSNTVSADIPIKKGDYIGFYFPGRAIIPFDGSECTTQRSYYVERPSVRVGSYYTFSQKQRGWNPCRKYSQIAVIAADKVNGGWSGWSKSGSCSKSCASGQQKYVRSCNNPSPAYGGSACSGSTYKYESCNTQRCPVNGGWSGWSKYGGCSKTCGSGSQRYTRSCTNPRPAYGGKACSGSTSQSVTCNTHKCPAATVDFGQSISYRRYLDSWSNAMYIWEPHRPVTTTGTVKQWKFYARRSGYIYLQVWRRYSSSYYTLIGQTKAYARSGSNTVNANIAIRKGDYLGFYFPGSSIIPFDGHECYNQRSLYVERPSVRVGSRYYFRQKQTGWNPCRKYSQIAVIAASG